MLKFFCVVSACKYQFSRSTFTRLHFFPTVRPHQKSNFFDEPVIKEADKNPLLAFEAESPA